MKNWLRLMLSCALSVFCVAVAAAQGFPSKAVHIVAPFTPAAIARLNAEANKALMTPDVREKLIAQAMYPVGTTPGEFDAHIRSEMAKYAKVIKAAGIKID